MNNDNENPGAPEGGWEGKLALCRAHFDQNELSPQMQIFGDTLWVFSPQSVRTHCSYS